jgi:CheY-like chemotaxis protein/anti-sigma regulatory factor (Ser/Thr protein kinase)
MQTACGVYLGDPTRTRQILCNLISNAIKFTHTGQIDVEIRYNAGDLIFTISDQGIGMPQEVIEGLFTKFSQADKSTTRRFGGTGLGLAICKQLADLMAGDISVTSRPGQGSTFVFRAPYARIGAPRTLQATEPQSAETVEGGSVRVLAAEDNTINRLVLTTLLQQAGIDPLVVENGQLAVDAWDAGDWDVILMDIQMPVMDGITATTAIRALPAPACQAPIIAVTANAMPHQAAEYERVGMNGLIAKPLSPSAIIAEIAKLAA